MAGGLIAPARLHLISHQDAAEKDENAWIAALYTRQPLVIRQQIEVAMEQNKAKEGPSSKAILQAEEYAKKLEDYEKEQEELREKEEEELRQEVADLDLTEAGDGEDQQELGRTFPKQKKRCP
ncbi:unnamed protein product [Durusdinium trenchii]|uniref:Uncharacterized protein n=1 Tax=Durusdinium trenchii TaxID=1381693 RepID=A0ABP0SAB0_9DINO